MSVHTYACTFWDGDLEDSDIKGANGERMNSVPALEGTEPRGQPGKLVGMLGISAALL